MLCLLERETYEFRSIWDNVRDGAVIKHGEYYGRVWILVFVCRRSMLKPARNNNIAMDINRKKNR